MNLSSDIQGFITDASAKFPHVSTGYLTTSASIESSNNPLASNGAAKGLFQFTPGTAAQYGVNPYDAKSSTFGAASLANDNYNALVAGGISNPTDAQLYLAHQQGASGALALLNNPDASATSLVGTNAIVKNGGSSGMTAGQFTSMWAQKYAAAGGSSANPTTNASTSAFQSALAAGTSAVFGATASTTSIENFAGEYFVRGAALLLGLGFVYVGLSIFKPTAPIMGTVTEGVKGAVKGGAEAALI